MKPIAPELLPVLKQYFGFTSFRPLQEDIIRDAMAGKDVFALLPTPLGQHALKARQRIVLRPEALLLCVMQHIDEAVDLR